ncbi:preprotein translocase subunit SecE [bacterium]|nr:preprotein translocase subunit SecE [bacterium]
MKRIRSYFEGVGSELKKVTFPSRDEVIQMTTLVVSLSILLAIMVGLLDFTFRYAVRWLIA